MNNKRDRSRRIKVLVGFVHATLNLCWLLPSLASGATVFCQYDVLSRLAKIDYDNGTSIAYTYDAAGNRLTLVTQAAPPSDHTAPVITITQPTTERLYVTTASFVTLSGTASDATGIAALNCTNGVNSQSISGTTSWSAGPIALSNGINCLTVSASDPTGNVGRASLIVVALPPGSSSQVLFQDDFNDNSIDVSKWTNWGNTVSESGQIMQVLQNVTDAGGNVMSKTIPINTNGIITITRNVMLNYSQNYFIARTYLRFASLPQVVISYGNMDYDSPPEMAVHGFYISRNDANPHDVSHNTNDVSSRISPLWDTWFKETISYNPQSGYLAYSMNDALQTTFNVGVMPQTNSPSLLLKFDSWGWWTGYQHLFDNLLVTQAVPDLDPASRDTDSDGMPDWSEMLAGTSATNPASCLSLQSATPSQIVPGGFVLEWASFTGINYSVNRATNLLDSPNCFFPLKTNIPGLPGTTSYTDTNVPAFGPSFYKISVDY